MTTSPSDDRTPSPPAEPVPDPSRPVLPPITRVNARILYAAAIFGLIAIWVVTFTVTSRRKDARPQPPPPVQDAQPNLDALAGLAERLRAAQEVRKRLAPAERPGPFDPFRSPGETPAEMAPSQLDRAPGHPPALAPQPAAPPPSAPLRYTLEAPHAAEPAPARSRLEEALAAPPLVTAASRGPRGTIAASAGTETTDRLVDLLAQRLPGGGDASGAPLRPATPSPAVASREDPATAPGRLVRPESPPTPYVLYEGIILPAVLDSAITSDLPGIATATLRDPVYDSPTGRHLLLPPGTRALGRVDSNVSQGDSRLLIAWHRLILPDGRFFEIPLSSGADIHGATGLSDRTDRHLARAFTSTLLLSILGAGAQLSQPNSYLNSYRPPSAGEIAAGAFGEQIAHLSTDILERDLKVKPTLTIRAGTAFGIVLQADLAFAAPYPESPEGLR